MAAKILNQSQAEAVYSAMCALNNVSGSIGNVGFPGPGKDDWINIDGSGVNGLGIEISLNKHFSCAQIEIYADQSAFATAYGLQQG